MWNFVSLQLLILSLFLISDLLNKVSLNNKVWNIKYEIRHPVAYFLHENLNFKYSKQLLLFYQPICHLAFHQTCFLPKLQKESKY